MLETVSAYGLDLLVPSADTGVGQALRENGEFARIEVELISELVGDGVLVDIGANIGAIALPVARHARLVIAVEANRGFANVLAANALNNRLYNLSTVHAAVGAENRLVKFPMLPLGGAVNLGASGFGLAGKAPEEVVRMTTLDGLAPSSTRLVKIDVEGHEAQVMQGAARTLNEIRPYWLVESTTDTPGNRQVMQTFEAAGYSLFWFYAPFVTGAPHRGPPPTAMRGDISILAVPPGAALPRWSLTPATGARPMTSEAYPYLSEFGFPLPT